MRAQVTLREALADPALLGSALSGDSWATWRALLVAMMGEPLTNAERTRFTAVTGRECEPLQRVEEFLGVIGRRGGKDRAASVLATYLAALVDWSHILAPGERPIVLCIGPDERQAKITLRYIEGVLGTSPILAGMVTNKTADTIELNNGIAIESRASNFRRIRGVTAVAVIATEAAFWFDETGSGNSDTEILNAIRPALATTGGPLIIITSPYRRRGEVWNIFKDHFGADGDPQILVAQGASNILNPTLPQKVIDRAMARDMASAQAEYFAQFRTDLADYVAREAVEDCIDRGVRERPPRGDVSYAAFIDPSGGSSDSMTLAIGHLDDKDHVVIDVLREITAPFDPESAVGEFVTTLRNYGIRKVVGDRYGGAWASQAFEKRMIRYEHSDRNKSELYVDLLPRLNARTVALLDNPRAVNQICGLERRTARGGRDSIDHGPGGHDDLANVIAGVSSTLGAGISRQMGGGMWTTDRWGVPTFVPVDDMRGGPF